MPMTVTINGEARSFDRPIDVAGLVALLGLEHVERNGHHYVNGMAAVPAQEQNAMLLLFSAKEDLVRYAASIYRPHSSQTSSLLFQLLRIYREDPDMSSKLDEFVRQTIDEMLKELPVEKRLEGLTPEQRVRGLTPEERVKDLTPEEWAKGLTPEGLENLRRALEEAQRRLQGNGSGAAPNGSN